MARLDLMTQTTIPAAGTYTATEVYSDTDADFLTIQAVFNYGAGGTSVKAYVQTTFDGGTTWTDIACFAFTTAALKKISALTRLIAPGTQATVTDGTLADNTVNNGLLGVGYRVKYIVTGTYTGASNLAITAYGRR